MALRQVCGNYTEDAEVIQSSAGKGKMVSIVFQEQLGDVKVTQLAIERCKSRYFTH